MEKRNQRNSKKYPKKGKFILFFYFRNAYKDRQGNIFCISGRARKFWTSHTKTKQKRQKTGPYMRPPVRKYVCPVCSKKRCYVLTSLFAPAIYNRNLYKVTVCVQCHQLFFGLASRTFHPFFLVEVELRFIKMDPKIRNR